MPHGDGSVKTRGGGFFLHVPASSNTLSPMMLPTGNKKQPLSGHL
ncbi:hypothetical protein BN2537_8953 [Streptomyces venezuelae]|nr:hypothetical protein BN2537_8953 [Streptomyces venezuelae]